MDEAGTTSDGPAAGHADVVAMPLGELLRSTDEVIDNSLRRLLREQDEAPAYWAAFNSAVPPDHEAGVPG